MMRNELMEDKMMDVELKQKMVQKSEAVLEESLNTKRSAAAMRALLDATITEQDTNAGRKRDIMMIPGVGDGYTGSVVTTRFLMTCGLTNTFRKAGLPTRASINLAMKRVKDLLKLSPGAVTCNFTRGLGIPDIETFRKLLMEAANRRPGENPMCDDILSYIKFRNVDDEDEFRQAYRRVWA